MKKCISIFAACVLLSFADLSANAESFALWKIGARAGLDTEGSVSLTSYEIYANSSTPWIWTIGGNTEISFELEGALGGISGEGENSAYGRLGPQLRLDFTTLAVSFVAGTGPAVLSEEVFAALDLGGQIQFLNSVGFDWSFPAGWSMGYRYQHISNAGLHDKNPGLNFHTLSIDYTF